MSGTELQKVNRWHGEWLQECMRQMPVGDCAAFDAFADQCLQQQKAAPSRSSYRLDVEGREEPIMADSLSRCFIAARRLFRSGGRRPKKIDQSENDGTILSLPKDGEQALERLEKAIGSGVYRASEEVSLSAQCVAFGAVDGASRDKICGEVYDPMLNGLITREEPGDGAVSYPAHAIVGGKLVKASELWLIEDGRIIKASNNNNGYVLVDRVDPPMAGLFIAMAFGEEELTGNIPVNSTIVGALSILAMSCEDDPVGCASSALLKDIGLAWGWLSARESQEEAKEVRVVALKKNIVRLRRVYEKESAHVKDKAKLAKKIDPVEAEMPLWPTTLDDLLSAQRTLGEMVGIAESLIAEEDAVRLAQKQEGKRRDDLDLFRAANATMRSKIRKAQLPYWRFTIAYDKAMECMPTALKAEEEYCIEKNKYDMGEMLLSDARNHPKKTVCAEWVEKCEWPKNNMRDPFKPTGGVKCKNECIRTKEVGYDTSEEKAISEAVKYCSRECR